MPRPTKYKIKSVVNVAVDVGNILEYDINIMFLKLRLNNTECSVVNKMVV